MSHDDVDAVIKLKGIPRNAKDVLIYLAHKVNQKRAYATGHHEAWPSRDTIAEMMDMSRSSVNRGLNWLIDNDLIKPIEETTGGGLKHTTHYLISMERVSQWNTLQPSKSVTVEYFDDENRVKKSAKCVKKCVTQTAKSVTVEHEQGSEPGSDQRIEQRTSASIVAIGSGDLGEGLAATADRASHEEEEQTVEVDDTDWDEVARWRAEKERQREEAKPAPAAAYEPIRRSAEEEAMLQAAMLTIQAKRQATR